ncbi:MAG: hypothetical protein L3J03_01190 [Desulfobacterales bacterium]|nr:hypothetical protein [Desulfobacterales bacterium]
MTDLEKLRVLLPHWIEHNRSHGAEFSKWAALARQADDPETAALIEQAAGRLEEAEALLEQALERLGGPTGEPHHHHHHE